MVVKDTCLFVINKYKRPHTCVNPYLNRDHHQLDSNLFATYRKAIIKAPFTLTIVVIQESVMEKWGYENHTKRRWMESIKHLDTYFLTFLIHIQSCHISSWP